MDVILYFRHHGVHKPVSQIRIQGKFTDYYREEDNIDEVLMLNNLPESFLPTDATNILLTVQDIDETTGKVYGSTGQRGLKLFKNWSKYYDAYCLELCRK